MNVTPHEKQSFAWVWRHLQQTATATACTHRSKGKRSCHLLISCSHTWRVEVNQQGNDKVPVKLRSLMSQLVKERTQPIQAQRNHLRNTCTCCPVLRTFFYFYSLHFYRLLSQWPTPSYFHVHRQLYLLVLFVLRCSLWSAAMRHSKGGLLLTAH